MFNDPNVAGVIQLPHCVLLIPAKSDATLTVMVLPEVVPEGGGRFKKG